MSAQGSAGGPQNVEVRFYEGRNGTNYVRRWLDAREATDRARILRFLARFESGNFSDSKGVGSGVMELRLHFGPGYRLYFGQDGETLVLLLYAGSKQRQSDDIARAKALWREYLQEKESS